MNVPPCTPNERCSTNLGYPRVCLVELGGATDFSNQLSCIAFLRKKALNPKPAYIYSTTVQCGQIALQFVLHIVRSCCE